MFLSARRTGSFPSMAKSPPISRMLRSTRCSIWSVPRHVPASGAGRALEWPRDCCLDAWRRQHRLGRCAVRLESLKADSCRRSTRNAARSTPPIRIRTARSALRKLELHLPQAISKRMALLGAYPITGPSALTVDFHSRNLGEFDTALRSLGYKRNGKTGTAALPVSLAGPGRFSWRLDRLARPARTLRAPCRPRNLPSKCPPQPAAPARRRIVRFDSVSAAGRFPHRRSPSSTGNSCAAIRGSVSLARSMPRPAISRSLTRTRCFMRASMPLTSRLPMCSRSLPPRLAPAFRFPAR